MKSQKTSSLYLHRLKCPPLPPGATRLKENTLQILELKTLRYYRLTRYKRLQVLIIIVNKKALVNISNIFNSKNPLWWNLLYRELLLMNVSKTVCGIILVLLWFQIIGKTIKTLGFHNKTHLHDLSSFDVLSRWRIQNFVRHLKLSVL